MRCPKCDKEIESNGFSGCGTTYKCDDCRIEITVRIEKLDEFGFVEDE